MSLWRDAAAWLVEPADEPALARTDEPAGQPALARTDEPADEPAERPLVARTDERDDEPAATRSPRAPAGRLRLLAPADAASPPGRVAVVGSAATATPLAAVLALALRADARARAALLAIWGAGAGAGTAPPGPSAPAFPHAGTAAARLARRGLAAHARGRLVWLRLEDGAATALQRAEAAVDLPSVVAVARPRGADEDALLRACDAVVVAAAPGTPLAAAALADLDDLGVPVTAVAPPAVGVPRALALAGLHAPLAGHALRGADPPPAADPARATDPPPATDPARATHPPPVARPPRADRAGDRGQASILLVALLAAILVGAVVLGAAQRAAGRDGDAQRAADLAALAGARAMLADYARLFEPATLDGRPNPRHLERADYLARGRAVALDVARRNGAQDVHVRFPGADPIAPIRIRVAVTAAVAVRAGEARRRVVVRAAADAELAPPGADGLPATAAGSGYDGPLAYRQGEPMRPDVAAAFDRMSRAARAAGVTLIIASALRTDAEQAVLWARHPDPRWVAPPGTSLHRYGTELDLGPPAAYGWLAANAPRFHFVQRYANEPWHFGYEINARSSRRAADGSVGRGVPAFVPPAYAEPIGRAAQRWNVSATLLAAQLSVESGFNPYATSGAGAQGIAQFMPGTAAALGLEDPFDAAAAIDAQAHLMRDLLRRFAAVPLALAAYNAGPAPVAACGCVPPLSETRAYVAKILGMMGGAGVPAAAGTGLTVRLVR